MGGALFWLVAAHRAPTQVVGVAAALFTSALFVNYATSLGLPVAVARFCGKATGPPVSIFRWAVAAAVSSSAFGTVLFALVFDPPAWTVLPSGLAGSAVFAACAAGMATAVLVDVRLLALRRGCEVLLRALVVAGVRMFVVSMAPDASGLHLFLACAGIPAVAGLLWLPRVWGTSAASGVRAERVQVARYAGVNYLGMLLLHAPLFTVPVVVLLQATPSENAAFYIAWSVMSVALLVPTAVGQVLLVEGDHDAPLADQLRVARIATLAVMAAGAVVGTMLAAPLARIYGSGYDGAARLLPPLLVAAVPWTVTTLCLAEARVRHDPHATVSITAALSGAVLVSTVVGTKLDGTTGTAFGVLAGHVVAAAGSIVIVRARSVHWNDARDIVDPAETAAIAPPTST